MGMSKYGNINLDHSIKATNLADHNDDETFLPSLLNLKTLTPMLSHREHTPTPKHLISRDDSICDVSLEKHGHIRLSHVFQGDEISTSLKMLDMSNVKASAQNHSKRRSSNVTKALKRFLPTRSFSRMQQCGRRLAVRTIIRRMNDLHDEVLNMAWIKWKSFKGMEHDVIEEEEANDGVVIRFDLDGRVSEHEVYDKDDVVEKVVKKKKKNSNKPVYYYNAPNRLYEFVYGPFEASYMHHWVERDFLPGWRVQDWKRRVRVRVETCDSTHVLTWNELAKSVGVLSLSTRDTRQDGDNSCVRENHSYVSQCSVPHISEIVRLHERYSTANIRAQVLEQKRKGRDVVNVFRRREPIVTANTLETKSRPRVFVVSPIVSRKKDYVGGDGPPGVLSGISSRYGLRSG